MSTIPHLKTTFASESEVYEFMKTHRFIGAGSGGECYIDKSESFVYKFYYSFLDRLEDDPELIKEDILKFSHIKNNLVIFPFDVISINEEIIGEASRYVKGVNLYQLNPFTVDLDRLIKLCELALKELTILTRENVAIYDTVYNTLLGEQLYLIDTTEYTWSKEPFTETLKANIKSFNISIMLFLISGIFDEAISSNKILNEMYKTKGEDISIIEFIRELKSYLSEILGIEVKNLARARILQNKKRVRTFYERGIVQI